MGEPAAFAVWFVLGTVAAFVFLAFARATRSDELRVLAVGLTVAAAIYVIFALVGRAGVSAVAVESVGLVIYSVLAVAGVRRDARWLALGWLVHPIWDFGHRVIEGDFGYAPNWYIVACLAFDLIIGGRIVFDWSRGRGKRKREIQRKRA